MGRAALYATVLCATASAGCADIDYRPATSHDEVGEITEKQVLSGQHVTLDQRGRLLRVRVKRSCDIVEDKEIITESVRKSDENVILEGVLMGLATAPITTGALFLYDSQFVYDSDPNERLYNSTGQDSAQALSILSIVAGTGMLVGSMVSLIRKTKPEVSESTRHEDGEVLVANRRCTGNLKSGVVSVQGVLDTGQQLGLGQTNERGELTVDLSRVIAPTYFNPVNPPLGMQVQIGSDSYGLVDLAPVAAHHDKRREAAWEKAGAERCELERTQAACSGVQTFINTLPGGLHDAEARALISKIGQPQTPPPAPAGGATIATSECAEACLTKCVQDAACVAACEKECT